MVVGWFSLLALLSGHLVGVSLGATGAGGALIAVPLLVYVLGRSVQEAVAISLIIVGFSALLGAIGHVRTKEIGLRVALMFGATGAPGAWVGARAHALVNDEWALLLFGLLMLLVSVLLLRNGHPGLHAPGYEIETDQISMSHAAKVAGIGLLIGWLTGFFGVGGGFLIVPALTFFVGFPIRVAIGTSLLITALMSVAGIAGHLQQGTVDLGLVAVMAAGSAAGLLVGAKVARLLSPARLTRGFALFTLVASISLITHSGITLVHGDDGNDERTPPHPSKADAWRPRLGWHATGYRGWHFPDLRRPGLHWGRSVATVLPIRLSRNAALSAAQPDRRSRDSPGERSSMAASSGRHVKEYQAEVPADDVRLQGMLALPARPKGIVLFAHGSGSSRHSPRNAFIARVLQEAELATLLIDLLTEPEAADRERVFAIDLLADRLLAITGWLNRDAWTRGLQVGYFGASTGAGAALQAAARSPAVVSAVVSRGGRPDLAEAFLPQVTAPTLLVVGANDAPVLGLNEEAFSLLTCPKELVVVPGATHLFEEPGTLEQVAELARNWFHRYLGARGSS